VTDYPFNPALVLEDGAVAVTATRFGQVAGVARVYDFGASGVEWIGYVVAMVTAIDLASGNEAYTIGLQLSASSVFTAPVDTATLPLAAVTGVDAPALLLSNKVGATVYRYGRLRITATGTTPSVRLSAFLAKRSAVDGLSFAQLVAEFQALIDSWETGGGGGSGESVTTYELSANGVDTSGVAGGQKAPLEALRDLALSDYVDNIGKALVGVGTVRVDAAIDMRQVNADLGQVRFQAQFGFAGTMLTVGRSAGGDNSRLSLPSRQSWFAWAGDPTVGVRSAVTLFHLDTDTSSGGDYTFNGSYAGLGLYLTGNVEKKRIRAKFSYVDLAVNLEETAGGSADTINLELNVVNASAISRLLYSGIGADMSVVFTGQFEGHVAKSDDRDVIVDENGKASTYDMVCRTYNGQGTGSFYRFNQAANDYADTLIFGGLNRHIHFYGRALNIESGRRISGPFRLRECENGRAWTGSAADGAAVPVEAVFIGRVIDAGDFHLDLTAITNSTAVLYGDDTYYSIGCDFGRSHVSCGVFKPFNGEYPLTYTALTFQRAVNCTFSYSQVHGKIAIKAKIQGCTIRLPATWARIGYGLTAEPGATFTLIIEGALEFGEAHSLPWLSQITGEQAVVFESITDKEGSRAVYQGGTWTLGASHRASMLALGAQASDINRDFRKPGLLVGCSADVAGGGAGVGKTFAATTTGWIEAGGGSTITPGETTATGALITHLGGAPSTAYRAIYDRLFTQLLEIDALSAGIGAWLLGMESEAASLKALFPAASGGAWHDLSKSGAPTWTQNQGFAMDPSTFDAMATGYDMTSAAEGAGLNDFLVMVGTRRDNPAYGGSDNLFDMTAANGKAKLRDRDNAEQFSIGTTATTAMPSGTSRMPDLVMGGRVDAATQFGVSGGRVVVQGAVSSGGGPGGMPDAISLGGSRELWCAGIFKASHFFTNTGGVIMPIGDRALVLHRAFTEALAALEAL
jgi:hypothetical protein